MFRCSPDPNYLYLSQKLAEIDDPAKREELLQAMAHGSAAAWGHLNCVSPAIPAVDAILDEPFAGFGHLLVCPSPPAGIRVDFRAEHRPAVRLNLKSEVSVR
jgi:hypothetical protein